MNRHQLYRHFGKDNELLYIGISFSAIYRAAQHRMLSHWWPEIERIEIKNFDTRQDLVAAEVEAIIKEKPKYNKHHSGKQEIAEIDNIINEFSNLKHNVIHKVSRRLLYKPSEAAELLNISTTRLKKLKEANEIGHCKIGKNTSYYIWDLIDFCEINLK